MTVCESCLRKKRCPFSENNIDKCTYYLQNTNENYLRSLDTEQLVEFLVEIVCGKELRKHIKKMGYINMHSYKTEMREWLKEKHDEM